MSDSRGLAGGRRHGRIFASAEGSKLTESVTTGFSCPTTGVCADSTDGETAFGLYQVRFA